ncbi:MAG: 30S ribosomal protein S5 [Parcubacteria group bacterium Gr01-1014_72]|nr:MAG: 30S ribosomal protein S5 [Parcubacteria group bacterium Gr01-1014_72]
MTEKTAQDVSVQTPQTSVTTPPVKSARPGEGAPRASRARRGASPSRHFRAPRERVRPEFDQKILTIRRVARVAAGGRRFNFSVALVAGNRRGSVGVGLGKGADTSLAIDKALRNAKKHLLMIPLTKTSSIPHIVSAKYCSAIVTIMPAPRRGLVAGTSVRDVLELGGVKDVTAKVLSGSKNKLNNARAAVKALSGFRPMMMAHRREEHAQHPSGEQSAQPVQPVQSA